MNTPMPGQIWKHHKTGGEYEIVGIGRMQLKIKELDMKECAVYRGVSDGKLWARPLEDFLETIKTGNGGQQRFSFIR